MGLTAAVEILLGLGAAGAYGTADFLGGMAGKRAEILTVVLISQAAGAVPLTIVNLFSDGSATASGLWLGAAAGVAEVIGALLLYRGLATGRMNVVAPIAGVLGAALPVAAGLIGDDAPSALSLAGLGLALVAVGLLSSPPEGAVGRRAGIAEAVGAGVAFGLFFFLIDLAGGEGSGPGPLVSARGASLVVALILVLVARKPILPPTSALPFAVGAGVSEAGANFLFLAGTKEGLLAIVAVLTSLYPAATAGLARAFLRERMGRGQLVGFIMAGVAVALMVAG
jgi:uncharacterized membrane protein